MVIVLGSTKNDKKYKNSTNKETAKKISEKQSQKRKYKKIKEQRKKERELEKEQRREQRKKEIEEKKLAEVKTKREERDEFLAKLAHEIPDTKKFTNHNVRVDAEIAEQKRREGYLKYVNNEPQLEKDFYFSR